MHSLEFLFVVALLMYSFVIWTHRVKKHLALWMIVMFGVAFSIDMFATIFVCAGAKNGWVWDLHTISGLFSLVLMGCHLVWAILAFAVREQLEKNFTQCAPYAWGLWLVSFVTGIPLW